MRFWDKWGGKESVKVVRKGGGFGNAVYCLGGLGVLIYYLNSAHTITAVVLAFIKAVFWPAFMAYHIYGLLGMH